MADCKDCTHFNVCEAFGKTVKFPVDDGVCLYFAKDTNVTTNADRIRSMTDEELAWELMLWRCEAVARHHGISSEYPDTQKTILEWLQQPAEQKSLKKIKKKC